VGPRAGLDRYSEQCQIRIYNSFVVSFLNDAVVGCDLIASV